MRKKVSCTAAMTFETVLKPKQDTDGSGLRVHTKGLSSRRVSSTVSRPGADRPQPQSGKWEESADCSGRTQNKTRTSAGHLRAREEAARQAGHETSKTSTALDATQPKEASGRDVSWEKHLVS